MTPEKWISMQIKERGIKQVFLADKLGTTEAKLSFILTGRQRLHVPMFLRLCELLNVDPLDYLEAAVHEGT